MFWLYSIYLKICLNTSNYNHFLPYSYAMWCLQIIKKKRLRSLRIREQFYEEKKIKIQEKLKVLFLFCFFLKLLMEISKHKNSQVMPLIKPYTGLRLPPDRYCLSAPNYRMSSHKAVKKVRSPIALMRGLPLCSNSSILKSMVNFFIRMYSMMAKIAIFFKENMIL